MDERWIWVAAAIAGGVVAGAVAGIVLRRLFDRDDRRPAMREIATPLSIFAFWLLTGTGIVIAIALSSPETLKPVPRDILDWLPNIALAGLLVIAGYGLGLTISVAVGRALTRAAGERQRSLERAVRSIVLGGSIILALSQLGVDTTVLNILIAAVAGGIALTMAGVAIVGGRQVASHVAAGRTLAPILEIGQHVQIGELAGVVTRLDVAHVLLQTADGPVLVPYGLIIDGPIRLQDPAGSSGSSGERG